MTSKISEQKIKKYFDITGRALKKAKVVSSGKVDFEKAGADFLDMSEMKSISEHAQEPLAHKGGKPECMCKVCQAKVVLDMAQRYYSDAEHFYKKGDLVNAFACLNYAHGWLDAGARLGLFDVGHDSELFTVD